MSLDDLPDLVPDVREAAGAEINASSSSGSSKKDVEMENEAKLHSLYRRDKDAIKRGMKIDTTTQGSRVTSLPFGTLRGKNSKDVAGVQDSAEMREGPKYPDGCIVVIRGNNP